jgi:hypothetical protein
MRLVVALVCVAGCARGGMSSTSDGAPGPKDAAGSADGSGDASAIDAAPDSPSIGGGGDAHLLLTEVCLGPTGSEFVEIANTTGGAVDLSHYYLSDNGNYWKLPAGVPTVTTGDFIVKFPAGAQLADGQAITVAIGTAAAFTTAFGAPPTYSITDATITHVTVQGTPSLTDAGEIVVLFQWDGTSALVHDVDLVLAGVPTAANGLVSKSAAAQGGSTYATDANTIPPQASAPPTGKSTKRILPEGSHETHSGTGNGITGDDETSENTAVTWDSTAAYSAPTPGAVPAGL